MSHERKARDTISPKRATSPGTLICIAWFSVVLTVTSAAQVKANASSRSVAPRPNVVILTIDTLRADHVGCYGYRDVRTPNIDSLAASGVRLEHAYTPVPITLPSHTVIFTGTYPMQSGVHDFSGNKVSPALPTMATIFKQQGYATGAVVASAVLDSRFGLNQGFDFYYDNFDFNRLLETNLDAMERPGNLVADEALKWLAQNYRKPFLLWMHLYDPHAPYRPPPPFSEQYMSHPYDGEIAFADLQVGRILTYLKQKALYDNTLIVLMGDHGEGLGEHGEKTHGFFIYSSTLHVPMIFKLPAGQHSIKTVAEPVSTADVLPTVLAIVKVASPRDVQGRSVLPLLTAHKSGTASTLYSESFLPRLHFNWSELRGVQSQNYHLIDSPKPELYDLFSDPHELNNLFSQRKAVSAELENRLKQVISQYTPGQESAEKVPLDPALMERLKSLGYAAFSGGGDTSVSKKDLPDPKDRIGLFETFSEAMEDSQHGRNAEAVVKLQSIVATEKDSVPVHYLLGQNYYRLHQFADAVRELEQVVRLSPDYALGNFQLGLAYANAGRLDEATSAFHKTLQLDATNFSAALNLGSVYLKQNDVADALAAFQQSVNINPDYAEGHRAVGEVLLYQQKIDGALAEFKKAVTIAPNDPRGHMSLAEGLHAAGLHEEAQQEVKKAQNLARR